MNAYWCCRLTHGLSFSVGPCTRNLKKLPDPTGPHPWGFQWAVGGPTDGDLAANYQSGARGVHAADFSFFTMLPGGPVSPYRVFFGHTGCCTMADWVERLEKLFPDAEEQGDMIAAVTTLDGCNRNLLWAVRNDEALKRALRKISGVNRSLLVLVQRLLG